MRRSLGRHNLNSMRQEDDIVLIVDPDIKLPEVLDNVINSRKKKGLGMCILASFHTDSQDARTRNRYKSMTSL